MGFVLSIAKGAYVRVGDTRTDAELGNILGIDKIHFLKEKTSAIIRHVDEDIESLKLAHDELQKIYESSLSKEKICGNQIFRCRY
ncbi:MAG: hypothetical protein JKY23_06940 [Nitrospinaceae bacterium]|nr:hypothetical protein [Nitrospinaceae bacterium]